jgi:hypothetical protein
VRKAETAIFAMVTAMANRVGALLFTARISLLVFVDFFVGFCVFLEVNNSILGV